MPKKDSKSKVHNVVDTQHDEDDGSSEESMEFEGMPEQNPQKILENLSPAVRDRVYALRAIQDESVKHVFDKFTEELSALDKKYEELYAPLLTYRASMIAGEIAVTDAEVERGLPEWNVDDAKAEAQKEAAEQKVTDASSTKDRGIKNFWLEALLFNPSLRNMITERDKGPLSALIDIRCILAADPKDGFTLMFFFDPERNIYFDNTCLTKEIIMKREDHTAVVSRTVGTVIQWKTGQNTTMEEQTKKQRSKKTRQVRHVTISVPTDSFFRYFQDSVEMNEEEDEEDEEDDDDEEEDSERFTTDADTDHEIALILKDRIILRAVEYFTGEVEEDDDDDEEEEDEEDEEEEEEEEEEVVIPTRRGRAGNQAPMRGNAGGKSGPKEQECKQQ